MFLFRELYWRISVLLTQTQKHYHIPNPHIMLCFILFFSYNSKQYVSTTSAHSTKITKLIIEGKFLNTQFSTIQVNKDVCAEQYRCATELKLFSILSQ